MTEIPEHAVEAMSKKLAKGLLDVFITPQWIPVSERLPEIMQDVLTYRNGRRSIERRVEEPGLILWQGGTLYGGPYWQPSPPTHWMPLPEPPATVTEQT